MFCKIRKGKGGYSLYACDRKRIDGKVMSNDTKIVSYAWHSLYGDYEHENGLIEELPELLNKLIKAYLNDYRIDYESVVTKLIELKKEYYATYKESIKKIELDIQRQEEKKEEEYEKFKDKFKTLYNKDISEKYKEGFDRGMLEGVAQARSYNRGFINGFNDLEESEKKLLKEAFKLMAMKYHPDREGDTDKMAAINNLKEKILYHKGN
ncbi:MAG: hypothetical protein E6X43_01515 [Peptostreptococcaceae bacterium]|nr:hypothetical protein [Peptostreptococcaceae bacterium]